MAKFEVIIKQIEEYLFEIEADTKEEAEEKAEELYETKSQDYHNNSDAEVSVYEI
jgi:hypothetical protein